MDTCGGLLSDIPVWREDKKTAQTESCFFCQLSSFRMTAAVNTKTIWTSVLVENTRLNAAILTLMPQADSERARLLP